MAEPPIKIPVVFDTDEASAERSADPLEDALVGAMKAALKVFEREIRGAARGMAAEFKKIGLDRLSADMEGIVSDTKRAANATHDFVDEMKALELRARAVGDTIAKTGNNANLGASIETQLRRITKLQSEAEERAVELARNPQLVRAFELRSEQIRTALAQDVRFVNKILEQQTAQQIEEERRRTAVTAGELRQRTALINAERSRNVVAQQRAGSLELEEARRNTRLKLQDERSSARQRLAIFQALAQQVRVLERAIGATFRGAGSLLGAASNAVSGATSRITSIFRRSDAQLNDGLAPALNQRTSIFRREMRQTEQVIQSSVVRQSALLQRAEVQASRGIAGAVSGRSQVGSLLGGGLAIGGGFALITKLREGFQESVNLNESLNKTRQIFGDATDEILAFADTSVDALFVTKSAALEAAANFGIFGKSAGLAGPELAGFSKNLTTLATDLASFNNTTIADATTAIAAALRGESEPIRKYGVLLNEAVLQQRALSEGIVDTIRKLTPQERVLAANAEILAQTAVQQGDAARTADDFANSSRRAGAASVEFFASIAKFAVPAATVITNGILPVFRSLTDLVNNEVGPGLRIVRDAAIGAGIGLGALLAAKGAAEAIRFLAIAMQALLTPLGLLVFSFAAVGAVVKVLAERSPTLAAAIGRLRDTIGELVSGGLRLAEELLGRLADVVTERVFPAVDRLSRFIARNLQDAFRASVEFVEARVLPVLSRLGRFIRDDVLPPFLEFVGVVRDRVGQGLDIAREAAVSFFREIEPFIDPLIAGFNRIGDAIRDALGGDFSGALERLRGFGREAVIVAGVIGAAVALAFINPLLGIGAAIAGLLGVAFGPRLLELIQPQVERFQSFLRGLFDIDFGGVAETFLGIVRRLGEIVGSVVTDRRFVSAVAAIGAAAVATGGAFVLGFAQGVRDNIPELIDLLGDALALAFREALKFALSNPQIIVGIIAGAAVLGAFRRAFATAGAAGASSFVSSFTRGTRAFFATSAFNQGLFGGVAGLEAAATRQATREAAALSRARTAASRDLALLGQAPGAFAVGSGGASTTERDSIAALDAVKAKFGEAQVAGALFRANVAGVFQGAGEAAGGFGKVLTRDVGGGFAAVRAGASTMATNIGQIFTRLKTDLKSVAGGLGIALGGAIASGIGAVLSGQALGTSDSALGKGIGLAGILSSALFASAATGGNVGVGVAVAAVGLLTAAFASNDAAAKAASDRIRGYVLALRDVKGPAEAAAFFVEAVNTGLLELGPGAKDVLDRAGIGVDVLAQKFADGSLNVRDLQAQIFALEGTTAVGRGGLEFATGDAAEALQFLRRLIDELGVAAEGADLDTRLQTANLDVGLSRVTSRVGEVTAALRDLDTVTSRVEIFRDPVFEATQRRLEATTKAVEDVGIAVDVLNEARTDRINEQISVVTDGLAGAREAAQLARDAVTSFFTGRAGTTNQLVDQLLVGVGGVGSQVGEAINLGVESALGGAQLNTALDGFGEQVAQIIQRAVTDNPNITTADLSTLLDPVRSGIEQAAALDEEDMFTPEAGQRLIDNINQFLTDGNFDAAVDFANQAQASADALEIEWNKLNVALDADVRFSREQISRALIDALDLSPAEADRILGAANISDAFTTGFDEAGVFLGGTLTSGIAAGAIAGLPTAENAVAQIGAALKARMQKDLQASSPSRVFAALGISIPEGLVQGILAGAPGALAALRELSSELYGQVASQPGDFGQNFLSGLSEIVVGIQPISDAIGEFVTDVFDAISALEGLEGVDLSKLIVGDSDAANPFSNTGRTANQFANDLRFRLNAAQPHPAGWIQTEDGTWVPPEFFAPPPMLGVRPGQGVNMPEGSVSPLQPGNGTGQFIENINITEATNARATARETVMALKTAPFSSAPLPTARRIPVDVVA